MQRTFFLRHGSVEALFTKNSNDFVVSEIPLYEFSGEGEHCVLHVRKKDMTTWQLIQKLSECSGAKTRDFGYAGLKDKDGMTTQYISVHKSFEKQFDTFEHPQIKILSKDYHNNKIKIGHLKGNRFFIRLKRVNHIDAQKLSHAMESLAKYGVPNFFGYQRFGKEGTNYELGRDILQGIRKERKRKMKNFYISAYQSHLFNVWLSKRLQMSHILQEFSTSEAADALDMSKELIKQLQSQEAFFKIFQGDILHHYPAGKAFVCEDIEDETKRFSQQMIAPTGWLAGHRSMQAQGDAANFEEEIFQEALPYLNQMDGTRRFAWIFLQDVEYNYKEDQKWFEMHFSLPKGSYATVILEELLHTKLKSDS